MSSRSRAEPALRGLTGREKPPTLESTLFLHIHNPDPAMTIVRCTDVGWKVQDFGGGSNEPVEPTGGDDEEDDDTDE
jgi:hypothetical protein